MNPAREKIHKEMPADLKAKLLRNLEIANEVKRKKKEERLGDPAVIAAEAEKKLQQQERTRIKARKKAHKDAVNKRVQQLTRKKELSAAERELVSRELARKSLLHFIKRNQPGYQAGWVHKLICKQLEEFSDAVARGESPRLMLFMPPRHGKSLIASQFFPAWHLGRHPDHEFIVSAYSQSLPMKFSRKTREVIREPGYRSVFPKTHIHKDIQAAEEWATTLGGGYITAGVGGGITGKGAHILVIDDPVKNREDAESDTVRQTAKDWYTSTAYTRLAPGGGVLVIMTRWHHDDLAGWLLSQRDADEIIDDWKVIVFPAVAMDDEYMTPDSEILYGEDIEGVDVAAQIAARMTPLRKKGMALHSDRYDATALRRIRKAVGKRDWTALYQQQPTPDEGDYIQKSWFRYKSLQDTDFAGMNHFISGDLAVGKKQGNDFTCYGVWAIDSEGNIYLREVVRKRMATHESVDTLLNLCERYDPVLVGIENGSLKLAMQDTLDMQMKARHIFPPFDDTLTPVTDKAVRGRTLQGMLQAGVIYYPADNPPWLHVVETEALQFPNGKHDDTFDMQAWAARMAKNVSLPRKLKRKKAKSWKDKLRKHVQASSSKSFMGA
jgi:predicted phage terminase large subunit-like protein